MTKTPRSRRRAGALLVVSGVLLIVVPLALRVDSTKIGARPDGAAPPLSATELVAVQRSRAALGVLPKALALIPTAMIDAAATTSPKAPPLGQAGVTSLLSQPQLDVVERAVQMPAPIVTPLARALLAADTSARTAGFPSIPLLLALFGIPGLVALGLGAKLLLVDRRRSTPGSSLAGPPSSGGSVAPLACAFATLWLVVTAFLPVVHGASLWSNALHSRQVSQRLATPVAPGGPAVSDPAAVTVVQQDLNLLQSVYADIVPALQAAATSVGGTLSAPDAVNVIVADPRLKPLEQLILGLSGIYGAGILSIQAAVAAQSTGHARQASMYLPLPGTLLALVLFATAAWLARVSPSKRPRPRLGWEPEVSLSGRLGAQS